MLQSKIEQGQTPRREDLRAIRRAYHGRTMSRLASIRIVLLAIFAVLGVQIAVQSLTQAFGTTGTDFTIKLASALDLFPL